MNKFTIASLALATAIAIAPSASASSISGDIALAGLVGSYTPTSITFKSNGFVIGGSGSLGLATGEMAVMNGGAYPNTLALNASSIGKVLFATTGAADVTLTIKTLTTTTSLGDDDVVGIGWLTETGYAPTLGYYDLSTAKAGTALTFSADASVTPEPSSLLLLGTGLLGLAFFAFRKAKSSSGGLMTLGM
jgi:hypothetical protein